MAGFKAILFYLVQNAVISEEFSKTLNPKTGLISVVNRLPAGLYLTTPVVSVMKILPTDESRTTAEEQMSRIE